jgi:hypothetical protein
LLQGAGKGRSVSGALRRRLLPIRELRPHFCRGADRHNHSQPTLSAVEATGGTVAAFFVTLVTIGGSNDPHAKSASDGGGCFGRCATCRRPCFGAHDLSRGWVLLQHERKPRLRSTGAKVTAPTRIDTEGIGIITKTIDRLKVAERRQLACRLSSSQRFSGLARLGYLFHRRNSWIVNTSKPLTTTSRASLKVLRAS